MKLVWAEQGLVAAKRRGIRGSESEEGGKKDDATARRPCE